MVLILLGFRVLLVGLMTATCIRVGSAQATTTEWLAKVASLEQLAKDEGIQSENKTLQTWLPVIVSAYSDSTPDWTVDDVHGMVVAAHEELVDWLG